MAYENFNMDEINEDRRQSIEKTIRTINVAELKAIGERIFPLSTILAGEFLQIHLRKRGRCVSSCDDQRRDSNRLLRQQKQGRVVHGRRWSGTIAGARDWK